MFQVNYLEWRMSKVLQASYYRHSDVVALASALLGKVLCTKINGILTSGKIVETEAYRAPEDKASHAFGNKRTKRTETMFSAGGSSYVYLCYGIHHLFNVVTGPKEIAHAVLIRAVEPIEGVGHMMARRGMKEENHRLTAGPGSLSKALGISTKYNDLALTEKNGIWIEDRGIEVNSVIASPRVGVDYAEECAAWPWRFRIENNPWCSPAK